MALVTLQKGTQISVPDLSAVLSWLFGTHVAPPASNKEEGDREDKAKLQAAAALETLGADPERLNCVSHTFLAHWQLVASPASKRGSWLVAAS